MDQAKVMQTVAYNPQGKGVLKKSYVAYFDELGTVQRLKTYSQTDLENDLQKYGQLLWFLNGDPDEDAGSSTAASYVVNTFSDNVSVCKSLDNDAPPLGVDAHVEAERKQEALLEAFIFLQGITYYQGNMIVKKTLLRGGITLGDAYARVGFVTGRAHVRAVIIEEDEAVFPRIVLDDQLVEYIEGLAMGDAHAWELFEDLLREDPRDRRIFIDYLKFLPREDDQENSANVLLQTHREIITSGLSAYPEGSAGNVRAKYLWLADYHDKVCDEFELDDLKMVPPFPGEVRFVAFKTRSATGIVKRHVARA